MISGKACNDMLVELGFESRMRDEKHSQQCR
jgi:hypothetical protein